MGMKISLAVFKTEKVVGDPRIAVFDALKTNL